MVPLPGYHQFSIVGGLGFAWQVMKAEGKQPSEDRREIAEERGLAEKEASEDADRQEAVRQVNEQHERISRIMRKAD